MVQNNLDFDVDQHSDQLFVDGGSGEVVCVWVSFDAIVGAFAAENEETLPVQSANPLARSIAQTRTETQTRLSSISVTGRANGD